MNNSHFSRGSGVFRCAACGRPTRMTGVQSVGTRMCPDDYELAGIYNAYQDEGEEGAAPYALEILEHCGRILAKGGELDGDALELRAIALEAAH